VTMAPSVDDAGSRPWDGKSEDTTTEAITIDEHERFRDAEACPTHANGRRRELPRLPFVGRNIGEHNTLEWSPREHVLVGAASRGRVRETDAIVAAGVFSTYCTGFMNW
jgi:hypothetical protein